MTDIIDTSHYPQYNMVEVTGRFQAMLRNFIFSFQAGESISHLC